MKKLMLVVSFPRAKVNMIFLIYKSGGGAKMKAKL